MNLRTVFQSLSKPHKPRRARPGKMPLDRRFVHLLTVGQLLNKSVRNRNRAMLELSPELNTMTASGRAAYCDKLAKAYPQALDYFESEGLLLKIEVVKK